MFNATSAQDIFDAHRTSLMRTCTFSALVHIFQCFSPHQPPASSSLSPLLVSSPSPHPQCAPALSLHLFLFHHKRQVKNLWKPVCLSPGKESCFERIVSRFGTNITYVVVGDGKDEEHAASQVNKTTFWTLTPLTFLPPPLFICFFLQEKRVALSA